MNKSFTKEHPENDFVWEENAEVGFDCSHVQVSEQDAGRTLKVFLS